MYSRVMPSAMYGTTGTGFAGSETNSSNARVASGAVVVSCPLAARYMAVGVAPFGGHVSCDRHTLVPVSNTVASGRVICPVPLR